MALTPQDRKWLEFHFGQLYGAIASLQFETMETREEVEQMTPEVEEVVAQVQANTDVVDSARTLMQSLFDMVEANIDNPAALRAALDQLKSTDVALADAIVANTPAAPAPEPTPEPTPETTPETTPDPNV